LRTVDSMFEASTQIPLTAATAAIVWPEPEGSVT
jgi:hypothetical protein